MTGALTVLLAFLLLTPLGLLFLHILVHRLFAIRGRRLTGHASGIRAIAVGAGVIAVVAAWTGVVTWDNGLAEFVSAAVYVGLVYSAMALLYIDAINIAETSLTTHTLLEIAWAGTLSDRELFSHYHADDMVRARMGRMISLGQIRVEGDRHFLAASWLLRFAQAVALWRRVIGLPAPVLLKRENL